MITPSFGLGKTGRRTRLLVFSAAAFCVVPASSHAQLRRDTSVDWLVEAGGEGERYLRALQLVGSVTPYPWSLRGFQAAELRALLPNGVSHPWSAVLRVAPSSTSGVRLLTPDVQAIGNSGFPYGSNDGPLWAGRGLTTAVSFGVSAHAGPVDVVLAPQFFRAENASFALLPNGLAGKDAFADSRVPREIDLPQRFGDGAYGRMDAGESSIALTLAGVRVAASSASEWWGPAVENPFLLGSNAGGFPHASVGSSRPVALGPLRVHLRVIAGLLQASNFVVEAAAAPRRSLGGVVGTMGLAGLPGLEVGVGRLFENNVSDSTGSWAEILSELLRNPLKVSRARALGTATGDEPDNQIASAFFRWVFPASGVEVYGEFGREDHSFDLRDLIVEPDQSGTYLLGFGRAWARSPKRVVTFRTELLNTRLSHISQVRGQSPPYIHNVVLQGHTQYGQVLGAPDAYGGGGAFISLEELSPRGRRSLRLSRSLRAEELPIYSGAAARPADVLYALGAEWLTFHGRVDFTRELAAAYNFNRGFSGDVVNLRASVRARAHW